MIITINKQGGNGRIDKFLVKELFSYTRGEIIRSIKAGDILVNRKEVKPSYILKEGDKLKVNVKTGLVKLEPNSEVKFTVIHKDKNVILVDKPAGLQVHPVKYEDDTLANGLIEKFPEIKNINDGSVGSDLRPGIVHRLDRDTSGIMVVARSQKAFDELKKLFQNRQIKKEYLAVIFGKLKIKKGVIAKSIARARNYKKQTVAGVKTETKIRAAVTEYEVLKEYENYSLVRALPKTGRTHQIRVHLASLGNPIVGDQKYGHKNTKNPPGINRQLLHAKRLEFELFDKKYSFDVPLPANFSQFIKSLDPAPILPELN